MREIKFGAYLIAKRNNLNLTVRDLAHLSGVDAGTISRVENEITKVTVQTAVRLLTILKVTPEMMMTELEIGEGSTAKPKEKNGVFAGGDALTLQDALLIRDNPDGTLEWLVDTINLISKLKFDGAVIKADEFGRKLKGESFEPYAPFPYPDTFTLDEILHIYYRGSIVQQTDVERYISQLPEAIKINTFDRLRLTSALEAIRGAESPLTLYILPILWEMYLSQDVLWEGVTSFKKRHTECCLTVYRWVESLNDSTHLKATADSLRPLLTQKLA